MEMLKEFMLLFRMTLSNAQPATQQITRMQNQWKNYIGSIASQAKLVSTSRIGLEGIRINPQGQISNVIYTADNETLSGNVIVKTTNFQEAQDLAKNCPVMAICGSVEVRSSIPMEI